MTASLGTHLKANGYQLLEAILENLNADPAYAATHEGRVIYNTTERVMKFADNAQYRTMLMSGLLALADFSSGVVDTDGTLAGNDDTKLATQRATKTYIDTLISTSDFWVDQGNLDASGNPDFPAADKGHLYHIDTPGKVGGVAGVDVQPGDIIIARADGVAAGDNAAVGAQWMIRKAPTTVQSATDTAAGIVELATPTEAGVGTDSQRAVTPAGVTVAINTRVPALVMPNVVSATPGVEGKVRLATSAEATAGTSSTVAMSPLTAKIAFPDASETVRGKVELATAAETKAKTDNTRAVTPLGLASFTGIHRQPVNNEANGTILPAAHGLGAAKHMVMFYSGDEGESIDINCTDAGVITWTAGGPKTGTILVVG